MKRGGFTLVELAIVMTIIGLLIGGILKGQELLDNARVAKMTQQFQSFRAAHVSFEDTYGGKAGDFLYALARLPGCTAATSCANGNGDSYVGPVVGNTTVGGDSAIANETVQFWKHLAAANLIGGVDPGAATLAFGRSHPQNAIGGGYVVTATANTISTDFEANMTGRLTVQWNNRYSAYLPNGWIAFPSQAARVDRKLDDGKPFTGDIRGGGIPLNGGACEASAAGVINDYNDASRAERCELYIVLEQ